MPRNRQLLLSTVFQTVLLLTCTTITTHHLWTSASGKFTSIELYKNYTDATKLRIQPETPADIVLPPISTITFDISDPLNFTIHNTNTTNTDETYPPEGAVEYEDEDEEASFYKHQLPRTVITHIIISLLACYWQLALERAFPARPRPPPSSSPHSEVNAKTGEYEDSREEEVIKKWMAQGKVRRASLSWCNTLVKWLLDVVVGGLWVTAVSCMVGRVLDFEPEEGVLEGLKGVCKTPLDPQQTHFTSQKTNPSPYSKSSSTGSSPSSAHAT